MKIQVARGQEAWGLMNDIDFLNHWSQLYQNCPWATSFQSPAFAKVWFDCYCSKYEPILLFSSGKNELRGMLVLAVSLEDNHVVNVGDRQAEYHAWICLAEVAVDFPAAALAQANQINQGSNLTFKYLPPGTPLEWIKESSSGKLCTLTRHTRPLLKFNDGATIEESLKKKSNRSKINRLKRFGFLDFCRIENADKFESVIDQIICYYDFRQGAVHDVLPFQTDSCKRKFHLDLMRSAGLLHVTVLRVGEQVVSALLGIPSGDEMQLGIIAHSPQFGNYSPGKLHILFLAQLLNQEGYQLLDLTAGGDPYKERFSNAHDEVFTLDLHTNVFSKRRNDIYEGGWLAGRKALNAIGTNPASVKKIIRQFKFEKHLPGAPVSSHKKESNNQQVGQIYRLETSRLNPKGKAPPFDEISKDNLQHLLSYKPDDLILTRKEFFLNALGLFESGAHAYTYSPQGKLLFCIWLADLPKKANLYLLLGDYDPPPNSVLLFGFKCFVGNDTQQFEKFFWQELLVDITGNSNIKWIYTSVVNNDNAYRQTIERLGFSQVALETSSLKIMHDS